VSVPIYEKRNVEKCLILSTCNRVEVYAVSENVEDCVESIKGFLSDFHNVPVEDFSSHLYVSIGHLAIRHLFRVASSIDSLVIGEPQILGQVKQAYKIAPYSPQFAIPYAGKSIVFTNGSSLMAFTSLGSAQP